MGVRGTTRADSLSCAMTRISESLSVGSALRRVMSAAPRGVAANERSSAITPGLRFVIVSSATGVLESEKERISPARPAAAARSLSAGSVSVGPTTTVQGSGTRVSIYSPAVMNAPPYSDVTVGDLLTRLARALPAHDALVYARSPRYTFETLEREARTIARGLMAIGVESGERVVVWATNVPEWVVLQFALAKIGAVLVTANP